MAIPGLSLEMEWTPRLQVMASRFDMMADEFEDMVVPLEGAAKIAARRAEYRFDSGGPGWAPLSEAYAKTKEFSDQILVLTGEMKAHATSASAYYQVGHSLFYRPDSVVDLYHQFGTVKMPAREFIGLEPEDEESVLVGFSMWMDRIIAGFGGGLTGLGAGESAVIAAGASRVSIRGAGGRFVG